MRILITGGFGFVGGRLGHHLYQVGHQVVLGSRNATSPPNWLPYAEVAKIDCNNVRALKQTFKGIDVLIHAAGMNALDCATNPVAALEVNGFATARFLDAAIQSSVKRFIYLSTAHVYANPLIGTITEETCPSNLHPYATSNLAGENVVLGATQRGEIEGFVLRLSNVFGTPMENEVNCWTLLINDLCRQISNSRKIVLRSDGNQQRDFISMSETCRILEYIITFGAHTLSTKVINVGSGKSQTVYEVARLIQSRCQILFGFKPEILRPKIGVPEKHETLEYKTNKLAKLGLRVSSDNTFEIDNLLIFCHASFKKS